MGDNRRKLLIYLNNTITILFYTAFSVLLIYYIAVNHELLLRTVFTCGIPFIAVSVFRHFYTAPRPYEESGEPPIVDKGNKKNSFPSRHVFSAFIIAMAFLKYAPSLGIPLLLLSTALALLRVELKVHYLRDVIAGALIAIVCGFIGFWLIP